MSAETLYTLGHSNLRQAEFMDLLRRWGIEVLVDIRAYPRSRRYPHFDSEILRRALAEAGFNYYWAGRRLGGMRKPVADSPHLALGEGLRGYADHTSTDIFTQGVAQLLRLAAVQRVTVMCAEKEPAQCHRSLLADYLISQHGVEVRHLLSATEWRRHVIRPEARAGKNGLVYDRHAQSELEL